MPDDRFYVFFFVEYEQALVGSARGNVSGKNIL